jgi:hypothetical protein
VHYESPSEWLIHDGGLHGVSVTAR